MTGEADRVRSAELVAALCLATDLGMGFPFEYGLVSTMTTLRLCDVLGVDADTVADTYFACLLMYVGCNVDSEVNADLFPGGLSEHNTPNQFGSRLEMVRGLSGALADPDDPFARRALAVLVGLPRAARHMGGHFAAMCEVAEMLAERLGMPPEVSGLFPYLTERWDGAAPLGRASGDEVPLPLRILHVGRDATYQRLIGGDDHAVEVVGARAGGAFDPDVVAGFVAHADDVLGPPDPPSVWDDVLAAEPQPWRHLEGAAVTRALGAFGTFSDLSSPCFAGHSPGVAELAAAAAEVAGFDDAAVRDARRAGHVHDAGRTAVPAAVWAKPGPLSADEWEQVRLHPYQTGRVLDRSPFLRRLGDVACAHHERLDGSGYPKGVGAASLSAPARLLAAADAFRCATEPRPYRAAVAPEEAVEALAAEVAAGRLDADAVGAVAEAAGQTAPDVERPAGLTDREAEVVGLLARGLQTKQIATELGISPKTADHHIQGAYRKLGVSTRAAATLFAAEHGLVGPTA